MAANARVRIALLSPYWGWGGNLGDAAILQAVIDNLRDLNPEVELVGICARPEGMRRHHGVSATTLVSYDREYYSTTDPEPDTAGAPRSENDRGGLSPMGRVKRCAADRFPAAYGFARRVRSALLVVPLELRHIVHALRFVRRADLLIVAGGGQLNEEWGGAWGHPYVLFKWTCAARLMGRPAVFLSVGVGRLTSRLGRWFATRALGLAATVSLRDAWSKSFAETHLNRREYRLAPDLAFSLSVQVPGPRADPGGHLTIGVSPIAYGQRNAWPTVAQAASDHYLQVLGQFVERQLAAGHAVVLFHTDAPDRKMVARIADTVKSRIQSAEYANLRIAETVSLPELLAVLPTIDVVVASRLHGIILSHLHAIPSLAISYDRKVATHMERVGQTELCLELEDLRLEELIERFATLQTRRQELRRKLAAVVEPWRHDLQVQYREALERV